MYKTGQFLLWRCPPLSVPHIPNFNQIVLGVSGIKTFKNWLSFLVFKILFFFSSRHESFHKVETGYWIALNFGTLKGSIRAHLGTKFG